MKTKISNKITRFIILNINGLLKSTAIPQRLSLLAGLGMIISCHPLQNADLILYNAKVYTVDEAFRSAEAFAVKDGKFLAIGSSEEILSTYTADNKIDAEGKFVYPGFYDAHCHFYGYGANLLKRAELAGTQSTEEILERLRQHRAINPEGWLEGRGWDQNDWENKQFPDKKLLDAVFPDVPVYLIRIDGHAAWVNSAALRLAGIDATTSISGGQILLKDGEPSGILLDEAMSLVSEKIPAPTSDFNRKALLLAQENCFKAGLTSVADAGLSREVILLIDSLQKSKQLKMRVYAMLDPSDENIIHFLEKGPYVTERLTVRSIKLYADGALGSRGACMLEPYSDDPENYGLMMRDKDWYLGLCKLADSHGYQVNTHCIGDSANRFMLSIYADVLKVKNDKRWRIEHAQVLNPADLALFGEYAIIPSVQPTHATSDGPWAEDRLGGSRMAGAYAYKDLLEQNRWLPLGTDFPIEHIEPWLTFYAAVTRKSTDTQHQFAASQALTREESLKGITIWPAKAAFEEEQKGSIEPGKWADFIILDRDLMTIPEDSIPGTQLDGTWVAGESVFGREK